MRYGRFENNILVEVYSPPAGIPIEDCFHGDVGFVSIPSFVREGWKYNENGELVPPDPVPEPLPAPASTPTSSEQQPS